MIQEWGLCDICKQMDYLNRKYYYYDIQCDCCNQKNDPHFEIVYYCNKCSPKPPHKVSLSLHPIGLDDIRDKKIEKLLN